MCKLPTGMFRIFLSLHSFLLKYPVRIKDGKWDGCGGGKGNGDNCTLTRIKKKNKKNCLLDVSGNAFLIKSMIFSKNSTIK